MDPVDQRHPVCRLSRRRALGLGATAVLAAVGTTACQPRSDDVADAEVDTLVTDWARAVRAGDHSALVAVWAAAPTGTADRLADALLGLGLTDFTATSAGVEEATPAARTASSTEPGPARAVDVGWRLPGDATQHHRVWVSAARRGDSVGLTPAEAPSTSAAEPLPLWWLQPVAPQTGRQAALLVGGTDPGRSWAGRPVVQWGRWADRAVETARVRTGRGGAPEDRVWFELPDSTEAAQQLLAGDRLGAIAALATLVGRSPDRGTTAPVHVVLDPPQLGALPEDRAVALLTHEAVHVVTDAPRTHLPLWVEEGLADVVAWSADDDAGWDQATPLLRRVRARGGDVTIPDDAAFDAAAADALDLSYAIAWSVCRWILDEGRRRGAADDGWALLRQWYDRQAPVDGSAGLPEEDACSAVLGMTPATRQRHWRDWLAAEAARR